MTLNGGMKHHLVGRHGREEVSSHTHAIVAVNHSFRDITNFLILFSYITSFRFRR
jgi:hypothetical protein